MFRPLALLVDECSLINIVNSNNPSEDRTAARYSLLSLLSHLLRSDSLQLSLPLSVCGHRYFQIVPPVCEFVCLSSCLSLFVLPSLSLSFLSCFSPPVCLISLIVPSLKKNPSLFGKYKCN